MMKKKEEPDQLVLVSRLFNAVEEAQRAVAKASDAKAAILAMWADRPATTSQASKVSR